MRGPYERLKYDLRRLWECPVCKRRERAPGSVTFKHCSCQMQQLEGRLVVMKLVEDGVQRIAPRPVIRHELPPASGTVETPAAEIPPAAASDLTPGGGLPEEVRLR